MRRRALRDAQTPDKLKRNRSLAANSQLSVEEKKRKIVRNLRRLESLGLVDSAHQYQGLVNELAKVGWGWGSPFRCTQGRWEDFIRAAPLREGRLPPEPTHHRALLLR